MVFAFSLQPRSYAKAQISRYRHHQQADLRWIHREKQPGKHKELAEKPELPVTPRQTLPHEKRDGNCGTQRCRSVAAESDPPICQLVVARAGSCS